MSVMLELLEERYYYHQIIKWVNQHDEDSMRF